METVLLTGASGFIGRHAVPQLLDAGYRVIALYYPEPLPLQHPNLVWERFDIFEYGLFPSLLQRYRPQHLLHLAWYAVPGEYVTSLENLRWVQASLELFRVFIAAGGERIVSAGTCFEYDLEPALGVS